MAKGALLVVLTIIFAGVVLDLAVFLSRVGKAQWEAENTALAAARQLSINGDQADALRVANNWLARNGGDPSHVNCCTFADWRPLARPDGILDTVTATSKASYATLFLDYIGLPRLFSVERSATAQVVGATGAPVCPWGIVADAPRAAGDDYFGLAPGRVYSFDLTSGSRDKGSLVPLDLAGSGLEGYQGAIAAGCRKEETGVWSVGDVVGVLSGFDLAATTLQALTDHYNFESGDGVADYLGPQWCDVTFEYDGGAGAGHVTGFDPYVQSPRPECVRGTLDGGAGRLVIVPVVSRPEGENGSVRILGLASMYIASWDRGRTPGGRIYGVFFDRARTSVESVDLTGTDDGPLAPLRIALLNQ